LGWYSIAGGRLVTRYWATVVIAWIAAAIVLRWAAPSWTSIAADGDLAFLPASVPSIAGQKQLDAAFPGSSARSQMVIVLAGEQKMSDGDIAVGLDIARRLHLYAARNEWDRLPQDKPSWKAEHLTVAEQVSIESLLDNLTQCIEISDQLSKFLETDRRGAPRVHFAYEMRGRLFDRLERAADALHDYETAKLIAEQDVQDLDPTVPPWAKGLVDVWTWRERALGHKLESKTGQARLISLHLGNEFTAVSNIAALDGLENLIAQVRMEHADTVSPGLRIEVTGSAAVGADMLRAAASSVRQTEGVTVVLVLLILVIVYRGPFLVAIPVTSIGLSLIVSTALVALLARDPAQPGSGGLGVFTTTRIFIVVLLFGAGTDFCLFFLARVREILEKQAMPSREHFYRVVARAWRGVHNALVASAMTTIVGLGLMWLSSFEKFRFSGPIIAISLAVTLVVCLTFTPAILSGLGRLAFWPAYRHSPRLPARSAGGFWARWWLGVGTLVVRYPAPILVMTTALLTVPAYVGWQCLGWVTYNFTEELSATAPSRRGTELVSRFFPPNANSPVTLMLVRDEPFATEEELTAASDRLTKVLYVPGVESVRSVSDPLGDYPPERGMSLFSQDSWRRRVLQLHRVSRGRFISAVDAYQQRLARFDVVLDADPFSLQAAGTLQQLGERVRAETADPASPWHQATLRTAGTTVGISDLREVTQADQARIQILVTLGVWVVLLLLLRHWMLASYLIFTVLLSYFCTLGITYGVFSYAYGADFHGLDWKVPLFLFVILVAVGQDYNVYLTTRILEEQQRHGRLEGIRRALGLTGGIITSCGTVMAGTFVAMTSPAVFEWFAVALPWLGIDRDTPVLRGITELGFALSLGVMLDTLVVRSLLVPTYFAISARRQAAS
jgi:putative drug exporter of the RND superfamily